MFRSWRPFLGALGCMPLCAACNDDPQQPTEQAEALAAPLARHGERLFSEPFPESNGRACATCHVLEEATTLRPASVVARLQADPGDPLFNRLDADDPEAAEPSFAHLAKGLVRVVLRLPDNMDLIDFEGRVVTPPDRRFFVWRGVPSVANTALTAPYQLDGREPSLQSQAQGAITHHAAGPLVHERELASLAAFQSALFSSPLVGLVAHLEALGVPLLNIPMPEAFLPLTAAEARGREVYDVACAGCHGSATTDRVVRRELADALFPTLTPEGNVLFEVKPGEPPAPVRLQRERFDFMNLGFGVLSYVGQLGLAPTFNASVSLPQYRFRFYKDASRQQQQVDLPPTPRTVSGDPRDLRPQRDERGAPIVGPNLIPQLFTTDPGRAAITGDPADFEAFDMPPLRAIAQTAPYFHDNSRETLPEVIDEYSRFVLPALPLGLPSLPPETPDGRRESLSPSEKADLLAFLQKL